MLKEMYTFPAAGEAVGFAALREQDVEPLSESVLTVLERVGLTCDAPEVMRALAAFGARVDAQAGTATFPRALVLDFVACLRREPSRGLATDGCFHAPGLPGLLHQLAIYSYDWPKAEKRLGCREDFVYLTKLADVLHQERGAGHSLLLSDVVAAVEPLEAALLLFQYAHNPAGVVVADARQIDYVREIEAIAGIDDPYWHWVTNVSFATPLRLSREAADLLTYLVRSGDHPAKVYNFGVSGASMPTTVGGAVTLAAAEIMALWMCARALAPDVTIGGNSMVQVGSIDMRGGGVSWWAFDGMIRSFAACAFLRSWTGVAVSPGGGEYTPSSYPGTYVSLEKAYRAMVVAAFTGYHPGIGSGHLEAGLTFSPVQLMLDRELTGALGFFEPPTVDTEHIGLDDILAVGHGEHATYLECAHTLRHFRHAIWQPRLLARAGWTGPGGEEAALQRAQALVDDLLAQYRQPDYDEDQLAKMRAVVEKARLRLT